ncbi:hypothetical protein, partial [Trebonia sp.]|uniref:hypothetical protein n=1 Tax=Trebonia sp. TaxID=2767075 RepID=UPI002618E066
MGVPSFSPCTGDRRGSAWHSIQSQAAISSQGMPAWRAARRYRRSPRASGPLAVAKNAVATVAGSSRGYSCAPGVTSPGMLALPRAAVCTGAWTAGRAGLPAE